MNVALYTLGCKVNQYESRAISEILEKEGFGIVGRDADVCIVNTCAVTAESERKVRQTVRRAQRENPGAYILVTGCAVQIDPDRYAALKGVHFVSGNRRKKDLVDLIVRLRDEGKRTLGRQISDLSNCPYEEMEVSSSERTRAYMKVEDGCGNRCAYCVIPRARGAVVSRSIDDCVKEARRLADAGYREIVLTGIEVASYGEDLHGTDLVDLILALEDVEGLERIRLSSIDPSFFRPENVQRLKDSKKLARHFHLSLQSGCDRTLAAMRRKYNTALVRRNISALRSAFPDVLFTADVIVGFPGESDGDFEDTLSFLGSLEGMLHVHVFAYSPRPQTEAASLPGQIPEEIKRARSARLIAQCDENEKKTLDNACKKTVEVLFETPKNGWAIGHTSNFIEVRVRTGKALFNTVARVRTEARRDLWLEGALLQ